MGNARTGAKTDIMHDVQMGCMDDAWTGATTDILHDVWMGCTDNVWTGAMITEKNPKHSTKSQKSHSVGTRLLSWFLVSFASGVVEWNCWMKQQSNTQKQGALMAKG